MVDLYRSRRGRFFRCTYWKRDESIPLSNDELILKKKPEGIFYAKIVAEKENSKQNIADAFRFPTEGIIIQTEDNVNIEEDDLVFFNNGKWDVTNVKETVIQKNNEFSVRNSKITNITIKRG